MTLSHINQNICILGMLTVNANALISESIHDTKNKLLLLTAHFKHFLIYISHLK